MNIYKLSRTNNLSWDEAAAFIVQAKNKKEARFLASLRCGDEGIDAWLSPNAPLKVSKIGTTKAKTPKVLLRNFRNG